MCSPSDARLSPNTTCTKLQTRRFLRRLKLDIDDDERAALLDALAGVGDDRASGEKGVSFESDGDGKGKQRAKRGGGDDKSGGDGGGVRVLYRDFLELLLAEQVPQQANTAATTHAIACFWGPLPKNIIAFVVGAWLLETVGCSVPVRAVQALPGIVIPVNYDKYAASVSLPPLARRTILRYGGGEVGDDSVSVRQSLLVVLEQRSLRKCTGWPSTHAGTQPPV